MAKRWAKETPSIKDLPDHVDKAKKKAKVKRRIKGDDFLGPGI
jgi:hypothetical protein